MDRSDLLHTKKKVIMTIRVIKNNGLIDDLLKTNENDLMDM